MKGDDISERLVGIAARVIKVVAALPQSIAGRHIADQLVRSATGAGANYEEARGAESRRDFVHKLGLALKELQEARYWLRLIEHADLVKRDRLTQLIEEATELCQILGASRTTAKESTARVKAEQA